MQIDVDAGDEFDDPPVVVAATPPRTPSAMAVPHPGYAGASRVIDDEDAELQAALKASLEGLPGDFQVPATPPRKLVHTSLSASAGPSGIRLPASVASVSEMEEEEENESVGSPPPAEVDAEEMRKRRLARFGA